MPKPKNKKKDLSENPQGHLVNEPTAPVAGNLTASGPGMAFTLPQGVSPAALQAALDLVNSQNPPMYTPVAPATSIQVGGYTDQPLPFNVTAPPAGLFIGGIYNEGVLGYVPVDPVLQAMDAEAPGNMVSLLYLAARMLNTIEEGKLQEGDAKGGNQEEGASSWPQQEGEKGFRQRD
jgi:hypothetical protein